MARAPGHGQAISKALRARRKRGLPVGRPRLELGLSPQDMAYYAYLRRTVGAERARKIMGVETRA